MFLQNKPQVGKSPNGAGVTLNGRYLPPPEDKDGKLWIRTSVIIQRDANELFAMWRDIESAPDWQEQIKEVVKTGDKTSHWTMRQGDKKIEWDAANMRAKNCPEADEYIQHHYRQGWAI